MKEMLHRLRREQRGITGLETAIILIAFVVVASVFSYVVLSAGFLATDQAKGTIVDGLAKTKATLELRGSILAQESGLTPNVVDALEFTLAVAIPGESVNVTTTNTVITYWDISQRVNALTWVRSFLYDADADNVLDGGDLLRVTISGLEVALATDLGINTEFTLEVKPPQGGVLLISRTTPPALDTWNDLH